MKFLFLIGLCSALPAFAGSAEIHLKENFDPLDGSFSQKKISKMESPQALEKFLIDGAAFCFKGEYEGVKSLVHKMALDYNFAEGDLGSFTIDSKTLNGKLSQLKFSFHMKSGATWTWDEVKPCSKAL